MQGKTLTFLPPSLSLASLSDSKLAGRCCDLLAEALRVFPEDQQVWTWSLYALLKLTTRNSKSVSQFQYNSHLVENGLNVN